VADTSVITTGNGVAFTVSYGVVAEIIAKACSSPQTAQLNAAKRSETLMFWVWVGMAESFFAIAVAAYIDPKHRVAIIAGGTLSALVTYAEYQYALKKGLAEGGPPTETY
jgi:hypothetical protein